MKEKVSCRLMRPHRASLFKTNQTKNVASIWFAGQFNNIFNRNKEIQLRIAILKKE